MGDELKDQRVVTMMSPSELETIDEWSFKHRIRSRGEAMRRLCQVGMNFDTEAAELGEIAEKSLVDAQVVSDHLKNMERRNTREMTLYLERELPSIIEQFTSLALRVYSLTETSQPYKEREDFEQAKAIAEGIGKAIKKMRGRIEDADLP